MTSARVAPAERDFFRDSTVVVTGGALGVGRAITGTLIADIGDACRERMRTTSLASVLEATSAFLRLGDPAAVAARSEIVPLRKLGTPRPSRCRVRLVAVADGRRCRRHHSRCRGRTLT